MRDLSRADRVHRGLCIGFLVCAAIFAVALSIEGVLLSLTAIAVSAAAKQFSYQANAIVTLCACIALSVMDRYVSIQGPVNACFLVPLAMHGYVKGVDWARSQRLKDAGNHSEQRH